MASGKVYWLVLVAVFGVCLMNGAEAGVVQKVKDTFTSIKNYFRHGHSQHEHCDQSKEENDNINENLVIPEVSTTTTTDFPILDVRMNGGEEEENKGKVSSTVPTLLNRRLIVAGSNDGCPEGQKMGIGNRCRTSI